MSITKHCSVAFLTLIRDLYRKNDRVYVSPYQRMSFFVVYVLPAAFHCLTGVCVKFLHFYDVIISAFSPVAVAFPCHPNVNLLTFPTIFSCCLSYTSPPIHVRCQHSLHSILLFARLVLQGHSVYMQPITSNNSQVSKKNASRLSIKLFILMPVSCCL